MSIETLKSDIQVKTKETVAKILKEAKLEAEKIAEDGKVRAGDTKSKLSERLKRELDEKTSMGGATEEVEEKKRIATLKQDLIDEVIKDAEAGLRKFVKDEDYKKMLPELAAEAINELGGNNFILAVNADDKRLAKDAMHDLQKRISEKTRGESVVKLDDETIDCIGGVVVYTEHRERSFDNTIDARLSKCRDETWQIAQILFGGNA
jgi:V/A-type H+-transporting ATPase subunit E